MNQPWKFGNAALLTVLAVCIILPTLPTTAQEAAKQEPSGREDIPRASLRNQRNLNPSAWRNRNPRMDLSKISVEDLLPHTWWNTEPLLSKLSLAEDQRKTMDAAFRHFLEGLKSNNSQEVNEAFFASLDTGDLKAARAGIRRMEEVAAQSVRSAAEMKLAVVEALKPGQRTALLAERPQILRGNWGQQANVHRLRGRRAAKPPASGPP